MLNALHAESMEMLHLPVLGAGRLPLKPGDWTGVEKNKNVLFTEVRQLAGLINIG